VKGLKVGLSAVAVQQDVIGSLWANGMTQNLVYLAMLLQRVPEVDEVYVVGWPDSPEAHRPSIEFGLRQMPPAAAVAGLDVIIEVGMRVPNEDAIAFRGRGGKLVSYVAGNSLVMNLEALVSSGLNDRAEILPPFDYDAIWITPTPASPSRRTRSRSGRSGTRSSCARA
jgi:hypothetical protein